MTSEQINQCKINIVALTILLHLPVVSKPLLITFVQQYKKGIF